MALEKLKRTGGYGNLFANEVHPQLSFYAIHSAAHPRDHIMKTCADIEREMVPLLNESARILDAQLDENYRLIGRVNEILLGATYFLARTGRLGTIRASGAPRDEKEGGDEIRAPFLALITRASAQAVLIDDLVARAETLFRGIGESISYGISHVPLRDTNIPVLKRPGLDATEAHFLERLVYVTHMMRIYDEGLRTLIRWAKKEHDSLEFIYARCAILLADGANQ